ncbi:unnamed protein product [Gongylonema pulchrum]|uniref:Uncharacterized protein n=1 Tax=Gongylonema pulchrum TaxID=637853 RepID=A0A183DS79_9BILA|nr:unnamed protein product [Gongylonema pulchrum]VDN21520.1 unnamed protein product [Gongylonema pulchrum]
MFEDANHIREQLDNLDSEERALQRLYIQLTGLKRAVELESMRLNALKISLLSSQRASETSNSPSEFVLNKTFDT